MTDKKKAAELLQFMEDEWDGKAIINALNPLLKDDDLANLYDRLVIEGVIRTQKRICITAEIEIDNGKGTDGFTLFDVPVDADISEEDFLHNLKKMMDVEWKNDGESFRYTAITDPKQNEERICYVLATLED